MNDLPSCWILTTPRTGSSMLCDFLRRAGLNFREWYNHSESYGNERWTKRDSMPKYCKVSPNQFERFFGHERFEIVEEHLPYMKGVYLRRNDLASQTASFLLASRSNVWNYRGHDQRKAAQLEHTSVEFSDEQVSRIARWLMQMDDEVWRFMRPRPHLAVTYESLVHRQVWSLADVFTYIGLKCTPQRSDKPTIKLSHPRKDELIERVRCQLEGNQESRFLMHAESETLFARHLRPEPPTLAR